MSRRQTLTILQRQKARLGCVEILIFYFHFNSLARVQQFNINQIADNEKFSSSFFSQYKSAGGGVYAHLKGTDDSLKLYILSLFSLARERASNDEKIKLTSL